MTRSSIASARQRFAQITDQSPRHAIRQDHPRDNAVFFGMGDPGNEPHVSVDRLDIDAGRECVGYHQRLGQGRVFLIVTHRSSQISINPQIATSKGENDAKSAHVSERNQNLIIGRRHSAFVEQQPQQETTTDQAPRESAAVEISPPFHPQLFDAREGRGQ